MALCDTLLWLATEDIYSPRWSAHILDEVRRSLVAREMCTAEQADWRINTMRTHFEHSEVIGYDRFIGSQTQTKDKSDRHVIAAAIVGAADQIVTSNLKHFPGVIEPNGIEVVSPDDFLLNALNEYPTFTVRALQNQAANLRRPLLGMPKVLAALARCGAPNFAREATLVLGRLSSGTSEP